jgi:hypothetical protein
MGFITDRVSIGLDLGQKADHTAVAVVQAELCGSEWHHSVRFLQRLPLGTPYPEVARRIRQITDNSIISFRKEMLEKYQQIIEAYPHLYVDATGLGSPFIDLLKSIRPKVRKIHPCYFTYGDRRSISPDGEIKIGKAWMVSRLQVLLQSNRIHFPLIPEAEVLAKELQDYEIRISENANEKYGAFKVGSHDDLVTALGLATMDDDFKKPRMPICLYYAI